MGSDNGTKKPSTFSELAHPRLFQALVVLHFVLACGGFIPAILAFQKRGKWYVNPIKHPNEWGSENHSVMKAHTWISLAWIGIAFLQYVITPQLLLSAKRNPSSSSYNIPKMLHVFIGYTATALLVAFAINANHLALKNGVAGLVLYSFLALITGSHMMWHLVRAIRFIRQKRVRAHIHQVCGLLCWTCFPGIIRLVAVAPFQYFLYGEDCDTMNTSGMMMKTFPICILGLAALRWAATGEKFRHADYMNFYVFMAADVLVGILGGTLFQCHPQGAFLEQVPGKPWTLRYWSNASEDIARGGREIFDTTCLASPLSEACSLI